MTAATSSPPPSSSPLPPVGASGSKKTAELLEAEIDDFMMAHQEAAERKIELHKEKLQQEHDTTVEKLAESFASATTTINNQSHSQSIVSTPGSRGRKQTSFFEAAEAEAAGTNMDVSELGDSAGFRSVATAEDGAGEGLQRRSPLITEYAKSPFDLGHSDDEQSPKNGLGKSGATESSHPFDEHEHVFHQVRERTLSQPTRHGHLVGAKEIRPSPGGKTLVRVEAKVKGGGGRGLGKLAEGKEEEGGARGRKESKEELGQFFQSL